MYRSPPQLRSGTKVKPVPLSATDKRKLDRSLSEPSTPTEIKSTTMLPESNKPNVIDPAYIENCVAKYLTGEDVFDSLVNKLAEKMKDVIEAAVHAVMKAANEEIKGLHGELTKVTERVQELETKLADRTDDLEQYQRRNNLRLFGIKETPEEDTDLLVVKLCREKLGVELSETAVCRSHRVGKQPAPAADGKTRFRPIIVRFVSYRDRRRVFDSKKRLKGSGVTIKEDLTARRLEVLQRAAAIHGQRSTWTQDGRILWVDQTGRRGAATRLADLA